MGDVGGGDGHDHVIGVCACASLVQAVLFPCKLRLVLIVTMPSKSAHSKQRNRLQTRLGRATDPAERQTLIDQIAALDAQLPERRKRKAANGAKGGKKMKENMDHKKFWANLGDSDCDSNGVLVGRSDAESD